MAEIIPAIIPKDFAELEAKIKLVEPYAKTVQLDVVDGIFASNTTWPYTEYNRHPELVSGSDNNETPKQVRHDKKWSLGDDLKNLHTNLTLEAHLMIDAPHRVLNEWLASRVKRIILHWEAVEKIHNHELLPYETTVDNQFPISNLAREIHRHNKQFGLALNLKTPLAVLDNFIDELDMVLLMSINPGFAGQEFQEEVIPRIKQLRQKYPGVKIGIDGGLGPQNIKEAQEAGADFLIVNSAIFGSRNIEQAIKELKRIAEGDNFPSS